MSQMGRYFVGIETMTGDVGGPIDPDNNGNLNLVGTAGLVDVTGFPLINTLVIDLDGSVANQYDCDVGTAVPVAHILNVNGVHGINTLGLLDTISIAINNTITLGDLAPVVGDALTITTGNETITAGNLNVTAGNINLPVSNNAGTQGFINVATIPFMSNLGTDNTFLGLNSGGITLTTASQNTGIGRSALLVLSTGDNNTAIGGYAGDAITTGSQNVAVGVDALGLITTGSYNTAIGYNSGSALTINDNSNILINNIGTVGDSNHIRIGVSGGGAGQQNNCYIAGINGVDVGSVTRVVSCSGDHLGTTVITPGTGVSVTGGANTVTIGVTGAVAMSFPTDAGTATPAANALTVAGGTNIGTAGAGSTVTVNLDAALTGITSITGANGCSFQTGITAGDTLLLKAYNNTTAGYDTFATLTANLVPTFDLATGTTIGGAYIYRAGGTDVSVADGGTGASTLADHGILLGHGTSAVTSQVLTDGQLLIGKTGAFDPVAATLTAGSNVTITNGAGSITIASSGLGVLNYTNVAVTPYTSTATDNYLSVDTSALSITIKLPDAATANRSYTIKDRIGDAATRNITVTTVTGAVLIDGAATFVMNTAYESINIIGNGSTYEIY